MHLTQTCHLDASTVYNTYVQFLGLGGDGHANPAAVQTTGAMGMQFSSDLQPFLLISQTASPLISKKPGGHALHMIVP